MYNGFKNRETWVVNLYLQNTETWYEYYRALSSLVGVKNLAEMIELDLRLLIPENMTFLMRDLMEEVMRDIDWIEVAKNFYDEGQSSKTMVEE